MNLPAGLGARLLQRRQEQLPVFVSVKDSFLVVAAVHQVVNRL
jgi:hypothetical protein